jgi:hypothetical protein
MMLVKSSQMVGKATVLEKTGARGMESGDKSQGSSPILLAAIILVLLAVMIIYLRMRNGNRR